MSVLPESTSFDDPFDPSPTYGSNDQSEVISNTSINGSSNSFNGDFSLSNDTMRFLFVAIATITILICLTICISACICMCLNRRRSNKRQKAKDHRLLPEQSEKILTKKLSLTNSLPKNSTNSNGKQHSEIKSLSSSIRQYSSSNINTGKTPIKPYYYDNLDDIPFIDESRPTSFIDMTRV